MTSSTVMKQYSGMRMNMPAVYKVCDLCKCVHVCTILCALSISTLIQDAQETQQLSHHRSAQALVMYSVQMLHTWTHSRLLETTLTSTSNPETWERTTKQSLYITLMCIFFLSRAWPLNIEWWAAIFRTFHQSKLSQFFQKVKTKWLCTNVFTS